MPINVSVSDQTISATTSGQTVAVGVSGGQGPVGPQGPTGATGATGPAGTTTWSGITDKPSTFAPSAHSHPISEVTGLQTALDGKQASGSYATLDGSGKVPAAQLPSYVDDVVEYANLAGLPATGETGKIYVALDTGKTYRWSGSAYLEVSASPASTDQVPEGTANLYHTTGRAAAAAPVQSVAGKTGTVTLTAADVSGLSTVATSGSASDLTAGTLPDARLPTVGGITPGTYGSASQIGKFAVDAYGRLTGAANLSVAIDASQVTSGTIDVARIPTGSSASTVCLGNDARLSDSRTPTAHKATHATGGGDALTAADIGAAASTHVHAAGDITSGTIATARLGSGTASASTFLRGDQTFAAPPVTSVDGATGAVTVTKYQTFDFTPSAGASGSTGSAPGPYTWSVPSGAKEIRILCVGGGAGGGSGRRGAAGTARGGGAGGSGGSAFSSLWAVGELPSQTLTIFPAAGGAGGAAITANDTNGNFGTESANSYVDAGSFRLIHVPGASAGGNGTTSGGAVFNQFHGGQGIGYFGFGNRGGVGSATGAGSASVTNVDVVAPRGGGGGGAATATDTSGAGGDGHIPYGLAAPATVTSGRDVVLGGTAGGGAGANGIARNVINGPAGGGGSGGGGNANGAGGNGGDGAFPGGGGGGGGASLNGNNSGKGGNGGGGLVRITVFY